MSYKVDYIPKNTLHNRRPGTRMRPQFITIHSTANPNSTAQNERDWLVNKNNKNTASWHICVDENDAVEAIPLNEVAWHAGDRTGNYKSIAIEICESGNREKTLKHAANLTARLLKKYGWGVNKLKRHYDWSRKNCPRILSYNNWQGWKRFKKYVARELEMMALKKAKVIVNDKECDAYIIGDKTFVEVRKPFELVGFKVNYNTKTKTTEVVKNG